MKHKIMAAAFLVAVGIAIPGVAQAGTTVPGHSGSKTDVDNNGSPDAGVQVVGNYTDVYDDGAGTLCNLRVTYKGDFGNDPYLDSGVIANHYVCKGPSGNSTYNYEIVSDNQPQYRGNPEWAVWGTWEYHVLTQGGQGNEDFGGNGNLVRPYSG
jgi:hypothetical protein